MPFLSELVIRRSGDRTWQLEEPLRYAGDHDTWVVPQGFTTDGASVPRIVVWLIPTFGRYTMAAVLHDWFCVTGIREKIISPVDADGVFRRVMRDLGVPPVKRWLMWTGVRWGALFNRRRRAGWWRTAPAVLAISIPALALVLLPAVFNALGIVLYGAAELVATGGRRKGTLST